MPDARRRSRPLSRHADVYTESDGLFGRLADLVIENPVRSGGFAAMALVSGAIITNAAYFQTAHHPDPFFVTRSDSAAATPAAEKLPASQTGQGDRAAPQGAEPEGAASSGTPPMPPLPAAEQQSPPAAPDASAGDRQAAAISAPPARPRARPSASQTARNAAATRDAPAAAAPATQTGAPGLIADTQRALLDSRLYDGPVDGILGPQTRAAISSFEMRIGLIPTGQPSPRLLQQIRKGYPAAIEPQSTGSVGDSRLKRVQKALNEIGYGPIPEDGVDGDKTAAAIRHFEADNRLPQTGRVSDALAAKLVMIGAMPQG